MVKIRAKKEKTGKYSLLLDIYDKGERYKEYLKIQVSKDYTKEAKPKPKGDDADFWELANRIRLERELQLRAEGFGIVLKSLKAGSFIEFFEKEVESDESKLKAVALKHFKTFSKGKDITFQQVTHTLLEDFKKYLLQNVASSSAHTYFSKLKWVWHKALQKNIITKNPFNGVSIKQVPLKIIVYLSEAEVQEFANTKGVIKEEIRQAFLFACFCGLRISDIRKLEFAQIQNGRIEVRMKKGAKPIYIPLNYTLEAILDKRDKTKKLVFGGLSKHNDVINDELKRLAAYLHIDKNLFFHVSRHTFATMSLTNGMDIYVLSKLMGHANITTTQRYAQIVDSKKVEAMGLMSKMELNI